MNTNTMNQLTQTISQHGFNLSGHELTAGIAGVAAAVRWLHLEVPYLISLWKSMGGLGGVKRFIFTGSSVAKAA